MTTTDVRPRLDSLFPRLEDVPASADFAPGRRRLRGRHALPRRRRGAALDGRDERGHVAGLRRAWTAGSSAGAWAPTPRSRSEEALAALDAAVRAWDHGRGRWPTMSVGARIDAVHAFVAGMEKVREESVRLPDVGDRQDAAPTRRRSSTARSSTSRTPIEALKELDRTASRFVVERGLHRPDPPRAARRRAVHGPVQLPAERDLHDADPGADHGQHRGRQAAALRRAAARAAAARPSRDAFPPGVVNVVYGDGARSCRPAHGDGRARRRSPSSARRASPTC